MDIKEFLEQHGSKNGYDGISDGVNCSCSFENICSEDCNMAFDVAKHFKSRESGYMFITEEQLEKLKECEQSLERCKFCEGESSLFFSDEDVSAVCNECNASTNCDTEGSTIDDADDVVSKWNELLCEKNSADCPSCSCEDNCFTTTDHGEHVKCKICDFIGPSADTKNRAMSLWMRAINHEVK